jgi:hypothetical protein
MKKIYDRTLEEQIYDNLKKHDKANTVFLKLLAKQKSKRRDWSDVRAETYPIEDDIKPRLNSGD